MRGKNILLVAMLLSIALASIGFAQGTVGNTKIFIAPDMITGLPGDTFWIDVNIENVEDLYGWQVKVDYAAGTRNIGAIAVEEGGFLWGPDGTALAYSVDPINGVVDIGCTILKDWPGISGEGLLCRIQFAVTEAGESQIDLFDTQLLDSNLDPINHQTRDSYFDGVNVELVMINIGDRDKYVGETAEFRVKVKNEDTKSAVLAAKARVDVTNIDTGRTTSVWTGQTYQYPPPRDPIYLYVDGFTADVDGWTKVGASPYLDAPDDGSYIVGTIPPGTDMFYTFEDFVAEGAIIEYVDLEVYCEGPSTENIDYDIVTPGFTWLGSWYGTGVGNRIWQYPPRWVAEAHSSDRATELMTEAGINDFSVFVDYFDPGGFSGLNDIIDSMRLHVVFASGRAPELPTVDGFTADIADWTAVGASPYLDAADDSSHIVGTTHCQLQRWFTFENISLGTSLVDEVRLWVYSEGPSNEGIDYDFYSPWGWLGSYYGTGAGRTWQDQPRWIDGIASDNYPELLTEEGINDFEVMIHFFDPGATAVGNDIIDAMYLEITFIADRVALPLNEPDWELQPGEITWLEPLYWPLQPEDVGTFTVTITVYFSYAGSRFNPGTKKVITRHYTVYPAPE